jgi:hypothetical protein
VLRPSLHSITPTFYKDQDLAGVSASVNYHVVDYVEAPLTLSHVYVRALIVQQTTNPDPSTVILESRIIRPAVVGGREAQTILAL